MGMINTARFDFEETVRKYLSRYGALCADALSEAIIETANDSVKDLRKRSRGLFKGTGKYAAGWTRTLEKGRMKVVATVHGKKPTYALAHLLEHGHPIKDGRGRTVGAADPYPHIEEVERWARDEVVDRFIEKVEGIE